jgi:hypothetical protein
VFLSNWQNHLYLILKHFIQYKKILTEKYFQCIALSKFVYVPAMFEHGMVNKW